MWHAGAAFCKSFPAAVLLAGFMPTPPFPPHPSHIQDTFWGSLEAPRVLDSFRNLQAGKELEKEWPGALRGGWVRGPVADNSAAA